MNRRTEQSFQDIIKISAVHSRLSVVMLLDLFWWRSPVSASSIVKMCVGANVQGCDASGTFPPLKDNIWCIFEAKSASVNEGLIR
jgi:hypothetical protein